MSLRVRLLAILVGLVVAGSGALIATRIADDGGAEERRGGSLTEIRRATAFSPIVSGQPQIPRAVPGYASCQRPGPDCAFVEVSLVRYAEIVGADPSLYVHVDPDVRLCPRPEGPEEELGQPPCREAPENLTVVLVMREDAAQRFERVHGCGTPVIDPCR